MDNISLLCIPIALLLGALPSALIVAMLAGKEDIRDEPDGKISAAAVHRRVGLLPFIVVVIMDIGKAALAVLIAQWLKADPLLVMLTGALAVLSHQWSFLLKFQGGRGATVICGALLCICTTPTLVGLVVAGLMALVLKSSSRGFGVGILAVSGTLLALQWAAFPVPGIMLAAPSVPPPCTAYQVLIIYPILLGLFMMAKAMQVKYRPGAPLKPRAGGTA